MNDLPSFFQTWPKALRVILPGVASLRSVRSVAKTRLALICIMATILCATAKNVAPVTQSVSISVGANYANPIVLQASDANGDPLTFNVVSLPTRGTLTGTAPNLTYTPFVNFLGTDSFTFVASDGRLTSTPAEVSIAVRPGLSINNISVFEGNSGTRAVTFTVSVTVPVPLVTFSYSTINGTATAGFDYLGASGNTGIANLFGPPSSSTTIQVQVIGDTLLEPDQTFLVQLFNVSSDAILVNGTGRCTIRNDDFPTLVAVGAAALEPENSVVGVGEPVKLSLAWTHPVGWRQLDSVDLLILDDQGAVLAARWHEADNTFSLFNAAADGYVRTADAGNPSRLETSAVSLDLQGCTGGGPPGQTATIDYRLWFKPQAGGRTFSVEAFATDDDGNQQGFESVGTITVLPR